MDRDYTLDDRFDRETGRVYLTGWDALARLPLMQRARDVAEGRNTAGYVSGYPGSPLGGLDSLLRAEVDRLKKNRIHFEPGINEDIAATAISGTQYLNIGPVTSKYDGVFGMWYGKGPGVERSVDAMRTASYRGVAPLGGVLALAGDDHDARSTITAQQSDTLFVHMHMPILNPSSIQEVVDYGLYGWALSRFSGSWVGFICLNDIIDSAATVTVDPAHPRIVLPEGTARPLPLGAARPGAAGLGGAVGLEEEIRTVRYDAARAFARANDLNKVTVARTGSVMPRTIAIVTAGKTHLDVMDALGDLGLDATRAAELGISVLKLGMTWPVEPECILDIAANHDEIIVVEPKHPIIEDQVARLIRQLPIDKRPVLVGKTDETGARLVPEHGALDAELVSRVLFRRISTSGLDENELQKMRPRQSLDLLGLTVQNAGGDELVRAAGFCSGCPHSSSTKVPEGSFNIGGTGCHGMAGMLNVPGRDTFMSTHMGGEGALWIGMAPFTEQEHTFQNVGDGTYSHSASMVIRAAVAAGTTMTFKVLLNGYISMTGGQSIPGQLTAQDVARQLLAEGVGEVVVLTDDPAKYRGGQAFPTGVKVHERHDLIDVERRLRDISGVTALVFDQACAAELRRERKRGNAEDPNKRAFINPDVCEGCGDCNVQSNCISVEPLETDLGRKRKINQSSCNKDMTCVDGYCPSFVTVYDATPRKRGRVATSAAEHGWDLPTPEIADAASPYGIVIGGVGGGGVLTVGALLGMAAHLEGKSASVLNESGLAQKNGTVHSHVRIVDQAGIELSPRIGKASADLLFGADMIVAAAQTMLSTARSGSTTALVNADVSPTVAFAGSRDLDMSTQGMVRRLDRTLGEGLNVLAATRLATRLMGDGIYANLFMLGYAAQIGALPVSVASIARAIEINGVSVKANQEAFMWGRHAAVDLPAVERIADVDHDQTDDAATVEENIEELIERRAEFLADYQNAQWADRFRAMVRRVYDAESRVAGSAGQLTKAATQSLFKLMSYKDEYEVARLYTNADFQRQLDEAFEPGYRYKLNFAPQMFNRRSKDTGRAAKWEIPSQVAMPLLRGLAMARKVRGTSLDVFGMTKHRRAERARIFDYIKVLGEITTELNAANLDLAIQIASLPTEIRGFDTIKDEAAVVVEEKMQMLVREFADTPNAMVTEG
ncbi:indolepyruvate ferredoxin oxidoreductase family protein [Cumulibacter soli]|uniref:indolepyruvate ferredoxin oxidoreductase family protein n=1 Tax=Cumulibacter soli TaxID=2546344 RepID=UPI0014193E6A|nr:indolepyruvate ferredoxin oxidoreductase family protein [Cumulibacter soli]